MRSKEFIPLSCHTEVVVEETQHNYIGRGFPATRLVEDLLIEDTAIETGEIEICEVCGEAGTLGDSFGLSETLTTKLKFKYFYYSFT